MVVRRKVEPYIAHVVWDSIRKINHQRLLANHGRLSKALQKERPELSIEKAEELIDSCIDESVIVPAAKGFGPQSYVIPSQIKRFPDETRDWYCIECHLAGDVEFCSKCHRVFHTACYKKSKKSNPLPDIITFPNIAERPVDNVLRRNSTEEEKFDMSDADAKEYCDPLAEDKSINLDMEKSNMLRECENKELIVTVTKIDNVKILELMKPDNDSNKDVDDVLAKTCSVCDLISEDSSEIKIDELNYLSAFIFTRIKNWLPSNILDCIGPATVESWSVESDKELRGRYLLYQPMDMHQMELKARTKKYKCLNEILGDILSIKHNVAIYHGVNSTEIQAAEYMMVDTRHDINEIRQCIDCYRHSNEKTHKRWFCIPCKPAHELVWAKQRGFSYWPAKLIKRVGRLCDVRFFGAKHLRAVIDTNYVKPIDVPFASLKIKRSLTFNKAFEELQTHQDWLKIPNEFSKMTPVNSPKKTPSQKRNAARIDDTSSPSLKSTLTTPNIVKRRRKSVPASTTTEVSRETRSRSLTESKFKSNISNSVRDDSFMFDLEDERNLSQDAVISSTQDIRCLQNEHSTGLSPDPPKLTDNKNIEAAERLRRQLEICFDRQQMIQLSMEAVQEQVDKFTEKIRNMAAAQTAIISDIKKKQWCYNCEQEAIYHCCWNTSYCSIACQQIHWHSSHKRNCRRDKNSHSVDQCSSK